MAEAICAFASEPAEAAFGAGGVTCATVGGALFGASVLPEDSWRGACALAGAAALFAGVGFADSAAFGISDRADGCSPTDCARDATFCALKRSFTIASFTFALVL